MNNDDWSIISNVFAGSLSFSDVSQELDAFKLEGIGSGGSKYGIVGKVIGKLSWENKTPFEYYSVKGKAYAVGFLNREPVQDQVDVSSARAIYDGYLNLESGISGHKALTALLNKTKEAASRRVLWKGGLHTFFPVKGIDLTYDYDEPLMLFRGPKYRYNILDDERIVFSLDVATRYVDSRPYLEHINSSGIDCLKQEIKERKSEMKRLGKSFRGVHFFYSLTPMDIGIDGYDSRPIREIPINAEQSVAEFLITKYGGQKTRGWLDPNQPGLRKEELTFAPQFLHKNIRFQDVPSRISAEHTFYTEDTHPKNRDTEHTAQTRWEKTMDLFEKYGFSTLNLGPHQIEFASPLEFPSSNQISPPLLIGASGIAVSPFEIKAEIKKGWFQEISIKKVYLYSSGPRDIAKSFYDSMVEYTWKNFRFKLPNKAIFLETDPMNMETQLQKSLSLDSRNAIVVAIIDERNVDIHDRITNICGRIGVPSKCIMEHTVNTVVNRRKWFPLAGFVSSLLTRAKCIPWVLDTQLSYDCYIATDVGRAKSENWVMMIVYDKSGRYRIGQTELTVGESVDQDSLTKCIKEAQSIVPDAKSLLYLRDGSVYDQERNDFETVVKKSKFQHSAIVAIRETTPFRVYRGSQSDIWRPHSGDYYILDQSNMVLCAAGADEYDHGTPSPITIDYIPIVGSIDRLKAIEDIFKLSYLNWASPGRSYSTPAPLRMAHRIARELSLGIERGTVPF
ncbi:MAG: hypothetical protein ACTSR9_14785 [Candidatus Thorarchaeota archaeon]